MMIVRCPACQTTFRARPEHLAARAGRVRCGHCYTPFNALENLVESPSEGEQGQPDPSPPVPEAVETEATSIVSDSQQVTEESATPLPSNQGDKAHALEERLALALSPSKEIDRHLGNGNRTAAYGEDAGLHEALTEPPDLTPDQPPVVSDFALPGAPAGTGLSTGKALRWSPVRNTSGSSATSLSNAVWPTLVAQPPEPETVQPDVFPTHDSADEASLDDEVTVDASWHAPPPEPDVQPAAPITVDPDDRPWRPVAQDRREPGFTSPATSGTDPGEEYNPSLTRYARGEPKAKIWLWALMVGVLLGSLAVQSVYVFRVEMARQWPQLRPVFMDLCSRLGCDMPLPRNAQAINVTASNLESDPNEPTSFILHARLRNEASYLQAHPHLELTLTDTRDRPVARRVLEPSEWLPPSAVEVGFGGRTEVEVRVPFGAPELTNATGYRLYAFYP